VGWFKSVGGFSALHDIDYGMVLENSRDVYEQTIIERDAAKKRPLLHPTAAAAARGGSLAMRPFLQNLYQTRATAYKDSVGQFVEGYREGYRVGSALGEPEAQGEGGGKGETATAQPKGAEPQPTLPKDGG
jgi:hypothetical protein